MSKESRRYYKYFLAALLAGTAVCALPTDSSAQVQTRTSTSTATSPTATPSVSVGSFTNNVCPVIQQDDDDGTAEGDDGDGDGDCCLVRETFIQMQDGSYKAIGDVEVGDETIAGKILEVSARSSEEITRYIKQREFRMDSGLFEYRGVTGTGQHVAYNGDDWLALKDIPESKPVSLPEVLSVYNLRMENFIIPVIDGRGQLLLFADSLNNMGRISELAMRNIYTAYKQTA